MTRDTVWTDKRLHKVFRSAGLLLGGRAVNAVLGLGYVAIAARVLGADGFGLLVIVVAYATAVGGFVKFQSWQAVLHYGSEPLAAGRIGDLQRIVRFSAALDLGSGVLGSIVGAAGVLLLAGPLNIPGELVPAAAAYATVCVFSITSTATGVLRLYDRFDLLTFDVASAMVVRLVGAVVAWRLGGGLLAFLIVNYLAEIGSFLYLQGMAWRELRRRGHAAGFPVLGGEWTRGFPGLWRFVWTTNLNMSLSQVFTQVGLLVVGAVLGPAAAALYRVARQVADALAKPARLLTAAMYPELARLWVDGDLPALHRLSWRLALTAGAVATLLLGAAALFGGSALALIAGDAFRPAASVMTWLVAAAAVGIWTLPLEPLLISTGRSGSALIVRLVASAAYLGILWPLLGAYGLEGGGVAALGSAIVLGLGMLAIVWRRPPPLVNSRRHSED